MVSAMVLHLKPTLSTAVGITLAVFAFIDSVLVLALIAASAVRGMSLTYPLCMSMK